MIARNEPQKNFNFFLKELTIFKKKNNFDFKIFFFCKNTDKIILEPILKKKVIKFGYLKNIYPIINILDYLILISKGESFPNVVGEAMCMNVPCITNNVGDCKKIIGNSGIVINNNKLNNLSKVLSEVFENKFKFLNGRERIIKYYRIEIICQQFEKLFNDIVYKN